MHNILIN